MRGVLLGRDQDEHLPAEHFPLGDVEPCHGAHVFVVFVACHGVLPVQPSVHLQLHQPVGVTEEDGDDNSNDGDDDDDNGSVINPSTDKIKPSVHLQLHQPVGGTVKDGDNNSNDDDDDDDDDVMMMIMMM